MQQRPDKTPSKNPQAADYRELLVIDRDDLEGCLTDHSDNFFYIADAHVRAVAKRDALKLEIEELHAALDRNIREQAAKNEEKTTEAGIQQKIKDDPDMRDLKQQLLNASQKADEWGALKEAFYQRGYMLRELVAITLKKLSMEGEISSTERATNELRAKQGDRAIERVRTARETMPMKRLGKKSK
jgi:hypothetical protein